MQEIIDTIADKAGIERAKAETVVGLILGFIKREGPQSAVTKLFAAFPDPGTMVLVQALKQAGNDLSRENIMKQALNIKDMQLPMMLPGIKVNTSPTDYFPIEDMQMMRFNGKQWVRFGNLLSGSL